MKNQGVKFDVIFVDPPYKTMLAEFAINKIAEYDLLKEDGIIVWESLVELKKPASYDCKYTHIDSRVYGDTQIDIYQNQI